MSVETMQDIRDQVRSALRWVIDPELGINVVDLGLIYDIDVQDDVVRVDMTMTTPACPLNAYLSSSADTMIRNLVPDVQAVDINLVWEPPWNPTMMTDAAREMLGW
ncbi:MAG: metal-sulfur cluster assembly factor [Anaerolineae bacterium]|nr:metal-sulfur cluster assembly factor [Anaerolineae bacterium]